MGRRAGMANGIPPPRGPYGKYYGLRRSKDGLEVDSWYFVLTEDDPHAKVALLAYAERLRIR
jgi:hypothetical protein